MTEKDGGPAFPFTWWDQNAMGLTARESYGGMSLRDYFAGLALTGLVRELNRPNVAAMEAYEFADAMLAAREQGS